MAVAGYTRLFGHKRLINCKASSPGPPRAEGGGALGWYTPCALGARAREKRGRDTCKCVGVSVRV